MPTPFTFSPLVEVHRPNTILTMHDSPSSSDPKSPDAMNRLASGTVREQAILLAPSDAAATCNIAKVLGFFGIPSRSITAAEFLRAARDGTTVSGARILCSADTFLEIVETWATKELSSHERMHSFFVCAGKESASLTRLVKRLVVHGLISTGTAEISRLRIANHPEMCRQMSDLTIRLIEKQSAVVVHMPDDISRPIISADNGALFLRLEWNGTPLFISTSSEIIDLNQPLERGQFDIRRHACTSLPIVFYTLWAFPHSCWRAAESNACIIIDDPLLRPRHGCVNYEKLLRAMKRHRFTTNIAFIPWNWRRDRSSTVDLFRKNRDLYSISVHGCDHTAAEFGSNDAELLERKAQQAVERMAAHEKRSGIEHSRVMIFPHGAFSERAVDAVKHTGFMAAASNETISTDAQPRAITAADFWGTALTCYRSFPVFTRRSPDDGLENIAWDLLVGKPALICIHHEFCRDENEHLTRLVNGLNSLEGQIEWRSLDDVLRRSFRCREVSPGSSEVQMFASELQLDNRLSQQCRYRIRKIESDSSSVERVEVDGQEVPWKLVRHAIQFDVVLGPGETALVRVASRARKGMQLGRKNLAYEARTMLRRYACELRDNYWTPKTPPCHPISHRG